MNLAYLACNDQDVLNRLADRANIRRNRQDADDLRLQEAKMARHDRRIAQRERKTRIMEARRNKRQRQEFEAGDL